MVSDGYFIFKNNKKLTKNEYPESIMLRLLVALLLCFSVTKPLLAQEAINGKLAYVVVDVKSGNILESRDSHEYKFPASLTKMMTLYVIFDELVKGKITPKTKWKVSKNASKKPASKLGLKRGSTITVEEAILSLIVKSANDVATVVAENISGSEEKFARRLTMQARRIGMVRTQFANASGLHNDKQYSTPYDMYILGLALQDNFPQYYKLFNARVLNFEGKE